MPWTTKPPFCDATLHTADTALGHYAIVDTTSRSTAASAPSPGRARKPRKHQCIGMHFETIGKAKACCEQH